MCQQGSFYYRQGSPPSHFIQVFEGVEYPQQACADGIHGPMYFSLLHCACVENVGEIDVSTHTKVNSLINI